MSTGATKAMTEPKGLSNLQGIKGKATEINDRLSVVMEIVRGTLDVILGPMPTDATGGDSAKPNGLLEEINALLNKNIKNLEFLEKQVKNIERGIG